MTAVLWNDILADPTNDRLWSAFADSLERAHQPTRATFIRLQCQWRQLTRGDPRRQEVLSQIYELWNGHQKEWTAELTERIARFGHFIHFVPQYGFADSLILDAEDFLRHGDELSTLLPLRTLVLNRAEPSIRDLAASPLLANLDTLSVNNVPIQDIATLVGSPHLRSLANFCLSRQTLGDEGTALLARHAGFRNLRRLLLDETQIRDDGIAALCEAPWIKSVRVLSLRANFIGDVGAKALIASSCLDHLEELYLDTFTGDRGLMWADIEGDKLNPISIASQEALRKRFPSAHCSFSKEPHFHSTLTDF